MGYSKLINRLIAAVSGGLDDKFELTVKMSRESVLLSPYQRHSFIHLAKKSER